MQYFTTVAASVAIALAVPAAAEQLEPVTLTPITHHDAALVVVGADGSETAYTPAELEQFATYSLTTTTPWREEPAAFEGVMLTDILAAHGLDDASAITIAAENNYKTEVARNVWEDVDILIATRVDGQAHTRRNRGPIQFVIGQEDFAASEVATESHLVWMAARIAASD